MDSLAAYIPIDRRIALATEQELPTAATGAVLFADISGYTNLTATLAAELGPERGAEELTQWLNALFGSLIEQVHAYRGSVISFGGDAITCWFDDAPIESEADISTGAARAVSCVAAMQQAMNPFRVIQTAVSHTPIPLGIKLAVTAGSVRRFAVGLPAIYSIDVLAGQLLQRMAAAEQLLNRDEIIVGREIVEQFTAAIAVEEWRTAVTQEPFALVTITQPPASPTPWPEIPALPTDLAQQWLLPPLYQRVSQGQDAFLGELRPATALFLHFDGIDYDHDPDSEQKLNQYISWVQTAVSHYEGHLLQIIIGDKGSYAFIIFGALIAHEDDNARAVAAAQKLCSPPDHLDFISSSRIGISRGITHTGACGGTMRRTYSVHGGETNVAARLMMEARPGQILLSNHVAQDVEAQYQLANLGAVPLKGIPDPIPIFSLEGQKAESSRLVDNTQTAVLVGREKEQTILSQQLDRLEQGLNSVVLIEGEAGIGKSHLINALRHEAHARAVPCLVGSGNAIERQAPYHAWRSVFFDLFGITEQTATTVIHKTVYTSLGEGSGQFYELLPLLDAVLPGHWQDNALTRQMDGEVRALNTRRLLIYFLGQYCQNVGSLLLILEDAYWFDSASWALLIEARKSLSPMMLVAASRPLGNQATKAYRQLKTYPTVNHLLLEPLPESETVQLICRRLGVQALPPSVQTFIQQQGEGHPFFSEELAFALRDAGHIQIEDGVCRLAPDAGDLTSLNFPTTIQGVITSRIDRLATPHQLTLKAASVIGRNFALRLLQSIYPIPEHRPELPSYLASLEAQDITLLEKIEPELTYLFKHALTQDVVYGLMTFTQRKQLHQETAEIYENWNSGDLSAHYPLLAYHWRRAENIEKALFYLEKAGEQALRDFSNEEAITFFKQAIEIGQNDQLDVPDKRRAMWHLQLGEAYVLWTKYEAGGHHLEEGLRLLGMGLPTSQARKVGAMLSAIWQQLWRRENVETAVSEPAQREQFLGASRAASRLVEVYYQSGNPIAASHIAFYALQTAEKGGVSAELAESLGPVGMFFSFLQAHGRARRYLQQAQKTAEQANTFSALSYTLLINCVYESGMGNWQAAEQANQRLIDTANKLGAIRRLHDGYQTRMMMEYSRSNFAAALKTADLLIASASQAKDYRFQAYGLLGHAYSNFCLGQLNNAAHYLQELHLLFSDDYRLKDEKLYHIICGLQAQVSLAQGDAEAALGWVDKTLALGNEMFQDSSISLLGFAGPPAALLTMWRAGKGDAKALQRQAKRALRGLKMFAWAFPIGKPESFLWQGVYQAQVGNKRRALRLWRKGLAVAEELAMPYETGRLQGEIGRFLPQSDPQKAKHLLQAHQIFLHLGSAHHLQNIEQQLERLELRPRVEAEGARLAEEQDGVNRVEAEADDHHQRDQAGHLGRGRDVEKIGS